MRTTDRQTHQILWRVIGLLALVVLLSTAFGPALPAQAQPPRQQGDGSFEEGPCSFEDVPAGLLTGLTLECGTLTVPEQHADPTGKKIELAVAIIRSKSANPAPDPVVFLQGGPGGTTIGTYLTLLPIDTRLSSLERDIVLFDQRGTKYSKPSLFCQEYYDEAIRQLDQDISKEESNRRGQEAVKACHDRFIKEGVNLSAYDSVENAADVESLRLALGYSKINLYGVSYGTEVALQVMRSFPKGLRSVIIDSVLPPQVEFIKNAPQAQQRALKALFDACAKDTQCNSHYPNLEQVFYQTADKLDANKVHLNFVDPKSGKSYPALVDGSMFVSTAIQMLYLTDLVPFVPRVIYEVSKGEYKFLEVLLPNIIFDKSINEGMYYSVVCARDPNLDPKQVNLQGMPAPLARMEQDMVTQIAKTCSYWGVEPVDASASTPVESSIPTLVLAGAFDPATPPGDAQKAAQTLSKSYTVIFPIGGHGQLTSGACQDSIFLAFLNEPNQKPDDSCVASQEMVFATPSTFVRFPQMLNLLNPLGSAGLQLGLYALALLFLLGALLVYPIVWLVRLLRGPAKPAAPVAVDPYAVQTEPAMGITQPHTVTRARPLIYRLAPWITALAAISLAAFIGVVYGMGLSMALANDNRILYGLPGSTIPVFILPYVALVCVALMLAAALIAWMRRAGSVWGRVYLTLLTLAGITCITILSLWGALTALFAL